MVSLPVRLNRHGPSEPQEKGPRTCPRQHRGLSREVATGMRAGEDSSWLVCEVCGHRGARQSTRSAGRRSSLKQLAAMIYI